MAFSGQGVFLLPKLRAQVNIVRLRMQLPVPLRSRDKTEETHMCFKKVTAERATEPVCDNSVITPCAVLYSLAQHEHASKKSARYVHAVDA